MPRRYPAETRRHVIELARAGTKVAQLATTFGMTEATIYNWLRQERIDRGEIPGTSTDVALELAAARKRSASWTPSWPSHARSTRSFSSKASPQKALPGDRVPDRAGDQRAPRLPHPRREEAGFYAWRSRPTSPRALRRIFLAGQIVEVHRDSARHLRRQPDHR
jgi:transposase-like protein